MSYQHHSVTLDKGKCVGCTNCLKRCPTEAIRVHGGKAHILDEHCIDCGECIRVCQHHAKVAVTDPLATIGRFPYKIALPAPALYGQFKQLMEINAVARALKSMGFDEVFDVARGADVVSLAVQERLKDPSCPKPLISSSCPAVLRLIQSRFPELIDNVVNVRSPMEVAAAEARMSFAKRNGVDPKDVGCFFITPCAAKMSAIRYPIGHGKSAVDGAISIMEVYGLISSNLRIPPPLPERGEFAATSFGIGWARVGGEATAAEVDDALGVDGIDNVIRVLEEIENNRLRDLVFFEGLACIGGCVGGPLAFENGFIAKSRIHELLKRLPEDKPADVVSASEMEALKGHLYFDKSIEPISGMSLDPDLHVAIKKMEQIEEICDRLPGLDCGSCGSPSCRALAEDIVMGFASENDCLFVLKDRLKEMAKQMVVLSESNRI